METVVTQKEQMEVAQMRFGVIVPLVQGTYTDVSMAAYCRRVALTPSACRTEGCSSTSPRPWRNGTSSMKKAGWKP